VLRRGEVCNMYDMGSVRLNGCNPFFIVRLVD
jgi:hypothetical protein